MHKDKSGEIAHNKNETALAEAFELRRTRKMFLF